MTGQVYQQGETLVCAATLAELETFGMENAEVVDPGILYRIPEGHAAVLGVGIPLSMLNCVSLLAKVRPSRILCTGIAGAYAGTGWGIGDLVVGETEVFADLGMETPEESLHGFTPLSEFPFADAVYRSPLALWVPEWVGQNESSPESSPLRVRGGHGATVNTCTGSDATGAGRRAQFGADFETMEGAAVALAAQRADIPVAQIRAISNFAARRDMRPENIRTAFDSLRAFWATHRIHLAGGRA